jgi:copper(I)-binding protein
MPIKHMTLAAVLFAASFGSANAGDIAVTESWARETPAGAKVGAAYISLRNTGTAEDTLVGAQTSVAGKVELHEHTRDGDVMRMREVDGGIKIAGGASVEMKPGGYHVMLMDLKQPLTEGQTVPVTLKFRNAGEVNVTVPVKKRSNDAAAHGGKHAH